MYNQQLFKQSSQATRFSPATNTNSDTFMQDLQQHSGTSTKQPQGKTLAQNTQNFHQDDEFEGDIMTNLNYFEEKQEFSRPLIDNASLPKASQQIVNPFTASAALISTLYEQTGPYIKRSQGMDAMQIAMGKNQWENESQDLFKQSQKNQGQCTDIKKNSSYLIQGRNIDQQHLRAVQDIKKDKVIQMFQQKQFKDQVVHPPQLDLKKFYSENQDYSMQESFEDNRNSQFELQKLKRKDALSQNTEQLIQNPALKISTAKVNFARKSTQQTTLQHQKQTANNYKRNIIGKSSIQEKQSGNFTMNNNIKTFNGTMMQVNVDKGSKAQQIIIILYGQQAIPQVNSAERMVTSQVKLQVRMDNVIEIKPLPKKSEEEIIFRDYYSNENEKILQLLAVLDLIVRDSSNTDLLYFLFLRKLVKQTESFVNEQKNQSKQLLLINKGLIQQKINNELENIDGEIAKFNRDQYQKIQVPFKKIFLIEGVIIEFQKRFQEMLQPSKQCMVVFDGAMKDFKDGIFFKICGGWQIKNCFVILDHKIIGEEGEIKKFATMIHLYCDKLNLKLVQKSSQ